MPKILYYSSLTHQQGGAINSMFKLADYFNQNSDLEVVVILPDDKGIAQRYREAGVPLRFVNFQRLGINRGLIERVKYLLNLPGLVDRIRYVIRDENIDIVHVNEISFFAGLIAAKLEKIPSICHVRVILKNRFWFANLLFTLLLRMFADVVIAVSDATRRGLVGNSTFLPVVVIYNPGVNRAEFKPDLYDRQKLREDFGFSDNFVVGLISKLIPVKGHVHFIHAARRLKTEHPDVDWKFIVVGGEVEGFTDYTSELQSLIVNLNLENNFIFLGQRNDVPQLLFSFDVAIHVPDFDDPFPGVVLEAMAMERPFIGSRSGGIPEQFEDGVSGILVEKGDIENLSKAISDFLFDPFMRERFGKAARSYALSKFSNERHFGEIEEIYWKVLKKGKKFTSTKNAEVS